MPAAETDFSPAEVDRARRYHRPLYLAFTAEAALGLAVAAAYAFGGRDLHLSDLDPPSLVYACLFSHPTPPERVASARAWKAR